ncbi:MAG: hypothetical protein QOE93_555, partial [Actinomycetota bacterium]|nr:hypothetical protein [Actinomycetota bacterium]
MATLGLTMALTVATATVASAAGEESRLVGLTNGLRASVGVPALVVDGNLSAVAAQWAAEMAAGGSLAHNPNLGSQVAAWDRLGENVGVGNDIDQVWVTLTNSAAHYANLVDSGYTLIGTGSASSGGRLYVVQDFAQVSTPAPSPVIAEPAPVIAEPAPEPEPAPAFVPTFI